MAYRKRLILVTYYPEYGTNQKIRTELWEDLKCFCESKGWKYNTYVTKGDFFQVGNIQIERKEIMR
jgi:hypothetical protein